MCPSQSEAQRQPNTKSHPDRSAATALASGVRPQSARSGRAWPEQGVVRRCVERHPPKPTRAKPTHARRRRGIGRAAADKISSGARAPRKARAWRAAPTKAKSHPDRSAATALASGVRPQSARSGRAWPEQGVVRRCVERHPPKPTRTTPTHAAGEGESVAQRPRKSEAQHMLLAKRGLGAKRQPNTNVILSGGPPGSFQRCRYFPGRSRMDPPQPTRISPARALRRRGIGRSPRRTADKISISILTSFDPNHNRSTSGATRICCIS